MEKSLKLKKYDAYYIRTMIESEPPAFHTDIFNASAFVPKDTLTLAEAQKRFVNQSTPMNVDTTSISAMIQKLTEKIDTLSSLQSIQ
jgi:hypothetical protein